MSSLTKTLIGFFFVKDRFETAQSLAMKLQREKEVIQTEFEMVKERWDKTHSIHQKLQVLLEKSNQNVC